MFVGGSKLSVLLRPAVRSLSCWLQVTAPPRNGDVGNVKKTSNCDPSYRRLNSEHVTAGVSEVQNTMTP